MLLRRIRVLNTAFAVFSVWTCMSLAMAAEIGASASDATPMHDHGMHGGDDHSAHKAMMKNQGNYSVTQASYRLPDVKLVDMNHREIALPAIFATDKPMLVNFIFTTCTTICPIMSATFSQAQDLLGAELKNIQMVSISIDPEQDTPEALANYAVKFNANPGWNFYTGKIDNVTTTLKAFDAYRGSKMNHEAITLMRKDRASAWVRLEGIASAKDLVAEYRKAISN